MQRGVDRRSVWRGISCAVIGIRPGRAASAESRYVAFEGDSISSIPGNYAALYAKTAAPNVHTRIFAEPGDRLIELLQRTSTLDASIGSFHAKTSILSVLLGNDLPAASSQQRENYLSSFARYLDSRRAVGWKVVLLTTLPRNSPDFNADRNLCNVELRAWIGKHCDYLCDFAADSVMGPDSAASNLAYYGDGVHPTAFGFKRLAKVYAAFLNRIV